jgi:hypothetical protein
MPNFFQQSKLFSTRAKFLTNFNALTPPPTPFRQAHPLIYCSDYSSRDPLIASLLASALAIVAAAITVMDIASSGDRANPEAISR